LTTVTEPLAVIAIAEAACMAFVQQALHKNGSVRMVRDEVEASPYWAEFCDLAAAGRIQSNFIATPGLGAAVLAWATTSRKVHA
jgi:hypothetical protein